jgi:hypothetical protein
MNGKRVSEMLVVRTIPELEEAIRDSVREVMVVEILAPQMLEKTDLFTAFTILEVRDSSQNVIAAVFQQRNGTQGHDEFSSSEEYLKTCHLTRRI